MLKRFLIALIFLVASSTGVLAFSCEQELVYCRQLVADIVESTHFAKDAGQADIIKWWQRKWVQGRPNGILRVAYHLNDLVPDVTNEESATFILPGDENISILLQVPVSEPVGEKFPPDCFDNMSFLKISMHDPGLAIDLNPYCSESYGTHEVGISLYWYSINEKPLVEISANGPACVPAMLYGYNKDKKGYELVAEKCGG